MIDKLKILYGVRSAWILSEIEELVIKYKPKIDSKKNSLSEKDVVLITYGDSIQKKDQPHLQTLKEFVDQYCLPEINSTHILPFFPYTSDDGFSVSDYFAVDKDLGTWDDISNLSKSSKLMFDAVINHMSKSSQWFQSYLSNEKGFQDFFIAVDPATDLSKVIRPRALPLLTPFKDKKGNKKYIWTTFSEDQVDLNYASAEVFIAVLEVLLFYISQGAKLIRLDAIAFLWKKIGTSCLHLPETHMVIKLYREIIELVKKDVVLITETNVPHQENISYFGNGHDEAQMVYNFTLPPLLVYTLMKGDTNTLIKWAQTLKLPGNEVCFFNFTASHDGVGMRPLQNIIPDEEIMELAVLAEKHGGYVSYKNNEDGTQSPYELNCSYFNLLSDKDENMDLQIKKMMLAQAVMLAMPGVPGIYIHSLVGSQNYSAGVEESGIKRRVNREKLQIEDLTKDLNNSKSLRLKIYNQYKKLLRIRIREKAFNPFGKAEYPKVGNDNLFIIKRSYEKEVIFTIYNFSNAPTQIKALSLRVVNLLNGNEITDKEWKIEPYCFYWFLLNSSNDHSQGGH